MHAACARALGALGEPLNPGPEAAVGRLREAAAVAGRMEEEWARTLLGRLGGRPSGAWVAQHHRIHAATRGR